MSKSIKQPKNQKISAEVKQQKAEVTLVWNQTFGSEYTQRFKNAQAFVDSECIRLMSKYTPMKNGILFKIPVLGTKIGSGHIYYQSPYARYQYYGKLMVSSVTGSSYAKKGESKVLTNKELRYTTRHPQAQKMWFEVMKANHKDQILRGAAAITRGSKK